MKNIKNNFPMFSFFLFKLEDLKREREWWKEKERDKERNSTYLLAGAPVSLYPSFVKAT